ISSNNTNTIADLATTPTDGYEAKWYVSASSDKVLDDEQEVTSGTYFVEQHLINNNTSPDVSTFLTEEVLGSFLEDEPYFLDAIALDASGVLYIAVYLDNTDEEIILKMTPDQQISYLVGNGNGVFLDPNGSQADVPFSYISDMVFDSNGNLFVLDSYSSMIFKISPNGTVTPFAGSGENRDDDGLGFDASFNYPVSMEIDTLDNLYVYDRENPKLRKITSDGLVSTLLRDVDSNGAFVRDAEGAFYFEMDGSTIYKFTATGEVVLIAGVIDDGNDNNDNTLDGIGAEARFGDIIDLILDGQGNLLVVDEDNLNIRKINLTTKQVTTIAGSGDSQLIDGEGTNASFLFPFNIAKNPQGNYYILDDNTIRLMKVKSSSNRVAVDVITATPTPEGLTTQIYAGTQTLEALTVTGTSIKWYNTAVEGDVLSMSTVLEDGVTYYASQEVDGLESVVRLPVRVQRISDAIQKMDVSKGTIVQNLQANISRGYNVQWFENETSINPLDNSVLITNGASYAVSQYISAYTSITYAGSENVGNADGFNENATFDAPKDMVFDAYGNLFVVDTGNHLIRKISTTGAVTTFAGTGREGADNGNGIAASFNRPWGLVIDSFGNLFVADSGNYLIRKITPEGEVTTFAGDGESANIDGTGTSASFTSIEGMAIDLEDNIYTSDSDYKIRKITPEAVVTTFTGSSVEGGNTDGAANVSRFNSPKGLVLDAQGNLFVADAANHSIRKITSDGTVSTLAGNGEIGNDDGLGSLASFNNPTGLAIDADNNLYVTDTDNRLIRKITPEGLVTTIVGNGNDEGENGVGLSASLRHPSEIVFDGFGSLYVTDEDQILKININEETSNKVNVIVEFDAPRPNGLGLQIYAGTKTLNDLTLTATAVKWYASATSSSLLDATRNLVDGATYYATQTLNTIESSSRLAVSVKKISEATQTLGLSSEATVANLAATPSAGYEAKWYADINSQEALLSSALINTATYYVAQEAINPLPYPNISTFNIQNAEELFGSDTFLAKVITVDTDGFLYVGGQLLGADEFVVLKISPSGIGSYIVGAGAGTFVDENGNPTSENISIVLGMVIDNDGNLFLAESGANRILKITPQGIVSVFAGSGNNGRDDGNGLTASFDYPTEVSIDSFNNLYVLDFNQELLRKITPQREVTTLFQSSIPLIPAEAAIVVDADGFIYLDIDGSAIYKISPQGIFEVIAGNFSITSAVDGVGENAGFKKIKNISFDAAGNLLVVDDTKIRKVDLSTNTVTTIAGNENAVVTDGNGLLASLEAPTKISKNTFGNHYLIDNGIVRRVSYKNTSNRVAVSIQVKETPTLSFSAIAKTFGDADFNLAATTNSSSNIAYSIVDGGSGEITLTGNTVSIVKAGTVILKASVVEDANYKAAETTTVLTINKATPSITFEDISTTFGAADFDLSASSTSTGTITYSIVAGGTGEVSLTGNTVSIVKAGTVRVKAVVAADENYETAEKEVVLTIAKANQTITFNSFTVPTDSQTFNLEATASSGLSVSFSSSDTDVVTINANTVTIVGVGTATISAIQPGNENYNPAEIESQTITITTLSTTSELLDLELVLYPNPATNVVSIKTESSLNLKVVIYDINGRTLKEIDGYTSNQLIDIADLSSGTYLIKVISSKGGKMMKRLIKL
ncbi:T9SS type A sorting domain-containing protein, partial [uncultured Polaribacter sp.]|uniref:T9SS type A sorting domain-containing protein n=1 Tax=uncultured Polaribacter sp. TaxID=174711 RepID=UPI00260A42D0